MRQLLTSMVVLVLSRAVVGAPLTEFTGDLASTPPRKTIESAEQPVHLPRLLGPEGAGPAMGRPLSMEDWATLSVWLELSPDQQREWDSRYVPVVAAWNQRARVAAPELRVGSMLMMDSFSLPTVDAEMVEDITRIHRQVLTLADRYASDFESAVLGAAEFLHESQAKRLPDLLALTQRVHMLRWTPRPIPGARADIEWILSQELAKCDHPSPETIAAFDSSLAYYRIVAGEMIRRGEVASREAALDVLKADIDLRAAQSSGASLDRLVTLNQRLSDAIAGPRRAQFTFRRLCAGTVEQIASIDDPACIGGLLSWWDLQAFQPVSSVRLGITRSTEAVLSDLCSNIGMQDALASHLVACAGLTSRVESRYESWIEEAHVTGYRQSESTRAYIDDMRRLRDELWSAHRAFLTSVVVAAREAEVALPEPLEAHIERVHETWLEFVNEPDGAGSWPDTAR